MWPYYLQPMSMLTNHSVDVMDDESHVSVPNSHDSNLDEDSSHLRTIEDKYMHDAFIPLVDGLENESDVSRVNLYMNSALTIRAFYSTFLEYELSVLPNVPQASYSSARQRTRWSRTRYRRFE